MALFGAPNVEKLRARHDVAGLIAALGYPKSERVRQAAAEALASLGEGAVPSLIPLLAPDCREGAMDALVQMGVPAGRKVIEVLDDPNALVRIGASWILGEILDRTKDAGLCRLALEPSLRRVEDQNPRVRQNAIYVLNGILGAIPSEDLTVRLVPRLAECLSDTDDDVRRNASFGLRLIGEPTCVEPLIRGLQDEDEGVRRNSSDGLGRIRDERAVRPLVVVAFDDPDESVRQRAREALQAWGSAVLNPLSSLLVDGDGALRGDVVQLLDGLRWEPGCSEAGAWYWITKGNFGRCAEIGTPAVAPLISALNDPGRIWQAGNVALALGIIGDKRALEPLLTALSRSARQSAKASYVVETGRYSARPQKTVDQTGQPEVLACIVRALGTLGDQRAVEPLHALLGELEVRDANIGCVRAIREALERLGDPRAVEMTIASLEAALIKERGRFFSLKALGELRSMGWQPPDDETAVAYLEATDYEAAIPSLSGQGVNMLWRTIEGLVGGGFGSATIRSEGVARIFRLLQDSGSPSNRQSLIELIFSYPRGFADRSIVIPPWFGIYTERLQVVAEVFRPVWKSERVTAFDNDGYDFHYRWDTRPLHQVMDFLCASRNPISTNLLIQMAQFPKVEVAEMVSDRGQCPSPHELEGVVSARERAGSELRRRGHPLYDPDAYQVEHYWHDAAAEATVQAPGKIAGVQATEPSGSARQGSSSGRHSGAQDLKAKDTQTVESLVRSLKGNNPSARLAAAEALGRMGDVRAVEPLTEALKDGDWRVRQAAAQAMEELGWNPGADETGAWYWLAKRDLVRCAQLGSPAVQPLLAALRDGDWRLRQFAAHRLGSFGDARAVEGLIAALQDNDLRVREAATEALGKMAPAVEPFIAALQVRNWQVREAAATALGGLRDIRAVGPLTLALREGQSTLGAAAARALGKIADAQAVEALIGILNDGHADVRHAAAEALGALGWRPGDGPGWLPPAREADRQSQ